MSTSSTPVYVATSVDVPEELRDDLIVVDDFYADPEDVREMALAVDYIDYGEEANFPGVESLKAYHSAAHGRRFASIIGSQIRFDATQWVYGKFRISTRHDTAPTVVHIDPVDWSAVIYLTPDAHERGQLGIFRSTRYDSVTVPDASELRRLGFSDAVDFDARYVSQHTLDSEAWEPVVAIPALYNRCVLLRGSRYFHGIMNLYGSNKQSGRLTQNFFFWEDANSAMR